MDRPDRFEALLARDSEVLVNGFTALGDVIGPSVPQTEVAPTLQRIVEVYRSRREDGERFIETYRRIGMTPCKENAYAQNSAAA